MTSRNKLCNAKNPYQGDRKKVLCLCSAGLLRSPTAALVLATLYDFNTRAAGLTEEYALIYASDVLLHWADEIVVMNEEMEVIVNERIDKVDFLEKTPIQVLNIPDNFSAFDSKLIELIRQGYVATTEEQKRAQI